MFVYCRILCIQESLSGENSGGFILTMSGFDNDDLRGCGVGKALLFFKKIISNLPSPLVGRVSDPF